MKNLPKTDDETWTGKLLHRLGVSRVEVDLSGGGDSGDISDVRYYADQEGKVELNADEINSALRAIKIPSFGFATNAEDVLHSLWDRDADAEGNWYDNEGGNVESAYIISDDGSAAEYCTISYNEYDQDEEYDDEDEYGEADPSADGLWLDRPVARMDQEVTSEANLTENEFATETTPG